MMPGEVGVGNLSNPLHVLKAVFGYGAFRPRQEEIIRRLLDGGNALVVMPTGGGKSLCYQLPALLRPGVAIVVSPLISLMKDQISALLQLGIRAASLNSSMPAPQQRLVERRLAAGELDLLYLAPERLMSPEFQDRMTRMRLALLAIDEAHCISQWGHDFRPEYLQIAGIRERFPDAPCIAVTATADAVTQRDILKRLRMRGSDLFVSGFDRPNIHLAVEIKQRTRQQLERFLRTRDPEDAGIVYCLSRKKVEEVAAWLNSEGYTALPYHAGLTAVERNENQERFLREEGLIVVATVAFGMGIDKSNVRFVAHVDLPRNPEGYYQEIGRAGRDGLPADAWMLYGLSDVVMLRRFIEDSDADERHKWALRHKLNAIIGYCETVECRRRVILNYFGEPLEAGCGNCDNCLNKVESWDGTVAAQKALSCVYRTGQRFGAGHVIDVLVGKSTPKIQRFRHDRLSTFGVGADLGETEWRSIIRQLVAADLLRVDAAGYGGLRLTDTSRSVLTGERPVRLRRDAIPRKDRPRRRTSARTDSESLLPISDAERPLFDRLRALRLELARDQAVPPYVIFHDSTLAAMARARPADRDALARIPGVGQVKLDRYGDAFLEVMRAHEKDA